MATRCTRVPRVRRSRQRPDTSPAARCATHGPRANGSPSAPAARCVWKGWAHVWWKRWKSKPQLKYVEICWTMLKWPSRPGRVLFLVVSTVVLVPLIVGELPICFWVAVPHHFHRWTPNMCETSNRIETHTCWLNSHYGYYGWFVCCILKPTNSLWQDAPRF